MSKSKAAWGSENGAAKSETKPPRVYDWAARAGAEAAPLGPESERRGGRAEDLDHNKARSERPRDESASDDDKRDDE